MRTDRAVLADAQRMRVAPVQQPEHRLQRVVAIRRGGR